MGRWEREREGRRAGEKDRERQGGREEAGSAAPYPLGKGKGPAASCSGREGDREGGRERGREGGREGGA